MKRLFFKFGLLAFMLLGLPMLGVLMAGDPISRYLEFPPESRYVQHAAFSWAAFAGYFVFIWFGISPFVRAGLQAAGRAKTETPSPSPRPFPWWGWLGLVVGAAAWIFAWTRFAWFAFFQPHTFVPLWISYIVVINALTYRKTGRCMMVNRPRFFFLLFPVSSAFWWFFEYLNRFVQNWFYSGARYGPWTYFLLATLSFATVLPAVSGTREWLLAADGLKRRFMHLPAVAPQRPKTVAWTALLISGAGLSLIGVMPNALFPLLWISPLLIVVSLQVLSGETHILECFAGGCWYPVVAACLSALICGFFWEMWNYYSLARWTYAIPLVHRFQIFEMPLLGYAGYLPFGLECAMIVDMLEDGGGGKPSADLAT